MTVPTFAVVPTKDRPGYLRDCIASLADQVDFIFVVDNGSTPPVADRPGVHVIRHQEYPPNISRLWNLGLEAAELTTYGVEPVWNVLVVNDDTVSPPDLVETLSREMRATPAVCAYPDQFGTGRRVLHTEAEPVLTAERICGYAFMLRGESGMRADEDFAWWFGDDDLDWRAREAGGSLLVPGVRVEHRAPDVQTRADPVLSEQTNADHKTWMARWGYERPVIM